LSKAEEDVTCYSRVAKFLLRCLTRIPTRTCHALLQQVFLEPFSRVLGQAKSKEVLITVAQSDPKHLNCLHQLGILLGITDWVKDYQKKLTPPQSQNNNAYTAHRDHAKIKEDVESTELALAFQLGGNKAESDIVCQPQKQPVFAYLPLRSFGFRFIIQGDFDIPSSREDVDRDSSWNQWLRSEIPQLFLKAMDVFTVLLPTALYENKTLAEFKTSIKQLCDCSLPFTGGKVVYKLPSQVAVCQDAVIRDVISSEELERHLSLSYLHPGLSPPPPASLLTQMGVRYLRGSDVTTVTTAMAKELVRAEGIHSGVWQSSLNLPN
ncbi:hypothetical protein GOODEAATRI_005250, partial [Goodea atripinnis]